MVSVFTRDLGSGLVNWWAWAPAIGTSIGSLAPTCRIRFFTSPLSPGESVIWVTTLPALATRPPSTDISSVLPAGVRLTRAIFVDIGGIASIVVLYLAQLPRAILERSTARGVGGPGDICAEATAGKRPRATVRARRARRDMARSI